MAQMPQLGDINFYGLHKVSAEKILSTINVRPGGPLPPSKGDLEDEIAKIPGVVAVEVQAVCCEGSATDLFIGIEERSEAHASFRSPPGGSASLPQDLLDSYHDFLGAVMRAAVNGKADEDLTAGHALMADPLVRGFQSYFLAFAADHVPLLREVLRNGSVADERAAAATIIGYAPNKGDVVNDLQYALQDPDDAVRTNATRALAAIAVMAQKKPDPAIRISPTWFVEMLNSVVLSDRVESTKALLILTEGGNQAALDLIRERALPALVEMSQWKTLRYALPPFLLLGRVAGLTDDQVHQSWEKGDRRTVIERAQASAKKRAG